MQEAAHPSVVPLDAPSPTEDHVERKFRPDVQGLRAVAVLLVVLFHAGSSVVSGGYVGVDVFFVISGFVITGVLLRDRTSSGRTSVLTFYGRRCRRIIPAATLVIVVTIAASYVYLGVLSGGRTAVDGRWASVFLVNFHFASEGTNYLSAQQLPSPLQNFWSLSVEEQFYLVYPTLFLAVAAIRTRMSLRARLAIGLVLIMVASFALSVSQTASNPTVAFFSPFTRAWELALGGLIAVGTPWLRRVPEFIGAAMTWVGLGVVLTAAVVYTSQTAYPGSLVAVPVLGAALIIAGGADAPRLGAESLLGLAPCGWLGNLSYSLYLWHWPILIIAAEAKGKTALTFGENLPWLALALIVSILTYTFIENPIRHARFAIRRPWASIALGLGLIMVTLVVATVTLDEQSSGASTVTSTSITPGTDAEIAGLVASSHEIQHLPADLAPPLLDAGHDWGAPHNRCQPNVRQTTVPACVFGDPSGSHTMVLYGDSHALMWFQAMDDIATQAHWRLVIFGKGYCMANKYPPGSTPGLNAINRTCLRWQRYVYRRIKKLDPNLVIVTQEYQNGPNRKPYTPAQWQAALQATFTHIGGRHTKFIVLGDIPNLGLSPPDCLAEHPDQVQQCSAPVPAFAQPYNQAERRAVTAVKGRYIDVTPWFCAATCSSVIGHFEVYLDQLHVTESYSLFLRDALAQQLQLPKSLGT